MLSLNWNEKVTCDNFGTQTTKLNLARHKESCSAGTMFSTGCPNFSTKSQKDPIYHFAKKFNTPKADVTLKGKFCNLELPGFYVLLEHKNTQHGFPMKPANAHPDNIFNDVDDTGLKEEF